jgi:cupin fold WbuC family metalloprotein
MSILEGEANLILFSDNGDVLRVLEMGGQNSNKLFYHKIVEPVFHTLIIQTPFLVYQEITQGPFIKSDTLYADWAPEVFDKSFMSRINQQLENMVT